MQLKIILVLFTCIALAGFYNIQPTQATSVADLPSTRQEINQQPVCLMNLNIGQIQCEKSNKIQQMVLIRGQLLPVESDDHGT